MCYLPCKFICMERRLCNKRELSGNNDPGAWVAGEGAGGVQGYREDELNLHLSTWTYARTNYWRKNPKQCVMSVYVKTISIFSETDGEIAGTDFYSSGSLLDKQLVKPLVFYPALLHWLKIKVPALRGRRKSEILAVFLLSSVHPRGLVAVIPLFPCPQTPFGGLHIF